ncbi:MAG TPA: hypothetical protein VGO09_02265 [Flavisolibacter sp.]|nr:hypothetical protein [Flavisolibacter sp.]
MKIEALAGSVIEGVSEVVNQFGKVIVLEDALVTHYMFLVYCNDGLNYYNNNPLIYGVSGYAFANNKILSDTCLLPIGSSWGWCTWKDKWLIFNPNSNQLLEKIVLSGYKNKFDFGYYPYFKMLEDNANGLNDSWAIRFYASFFLEHGMFLFPKNTLVKNIGFDNSGIHSGNELAFDQEFGKEKIKVGVIKDNKSAISIVKKYFKFKFKQPIVKRLTNFFKW